ncbi:hypothetical protein [Pseudocitrobacter sp. 73]|uniref:hypothetical protein n=1 Tax=Pseudocitrobacter sp. 73 TaxID=2605731 RepID=UPI0011ECC12E|nr:hypothetical protein [Pseudocitrobacter sp. 73]KAA1047225.1 hypothetical protein F0Q32_20105 [Pseudocitrobacter sp. 73]
MFKLIMEVDLIHESGISWDIHIFFSQESDVSSTDITFDDGKYHVDIVLMQFTQIKVKDIFHSFVKYMEYSQFSHYRKRVFDDRVEYDFVTAGANNKGFYCTLSFRKQSSPQHLLI